MDRVNEEILCFSTILRTLAHSVRAQFGALDDETDRRSRSKNTTATAATAADKDKDKDKEATTTANTTAKTTTVEHDTDHEEQKPLSLDETIELLDLAGQLLESDNNSYRIRALLLETRPNIVEVLVAILVSNPLSIVPPSAAVTGPGARSSSLAGASTLRHEHEHVQRRFTSLQWKAMSILARSCALAAPTEATASHFGFVLDSFEVLSIALRYLVMEDAGVSLRTCAAEVLFLCLTKLQLAQRAAASPDTVDTIVFQLAESENNAAGTEDTLRCYLVGALHAMGPVERLLSADFMDVAIGVLRDGPVYAVTKVLELLALLCKRNPHFVPSSLPQDRVLLLAETLGGVLTRLGDHSEVIIAVCRVVEICAIVSALAVEDAAIVTASQRSERDRGNPFANTPSTPYTSLSYQTPHHHNNSNNKGGGNNHNNPHQREQQNPEEGPGRFLILFTHEHGAWRHLLIAGKTDPTLVEARAHQMRAMRVTLQCLIHPSAMQRLADELGRDLPLFSALLSAPLRLPPFHDASGDPYVAEASLCLTFLMAKVPSFRANVRRAVATFPAWLQNLEQRLVMGMEQGLQSVAGEIASIQLVDVCGNLLNSVGFVDRFAPRAWGDVQALEVCVARLFEFQLRVDPNEPRPPLANPGAADDDGAPFVAVFVDNERKAMVLTTGILAYAICLSFQEVDPQLEPYLTRHNSQSEQDGFGFTTDPSMVAHGLTPAQQQRAQSNTPFAGNSRGTSVAGAGVANNNNNPRSYSSQQLQQQQNQQPQQSNVFFTDDVEHNTDASEYSEAQSESNYAAAAAAKHHYPANNSARPSIYSLHAMKSRGEHHHNPNQFSVPASRETSLQRPGGAGGTATTVGNSAAKPGFVQRNVFSGRFEPVTPQQQQQQQQPQYVQHLGGGAVPPMGGGTTISSVIKRPAPVAGSSRPTTPRANSSNSRRGTPTGRSMSGAGPIVPKAGAKIVHRSWH